MTNQTPRFSTNDVTVVFFLGGPGSGKGTQSANLVRDYGFVHLSAGDLLRAEQIREGSQYGQMIKEYITEGKIVPMEVTVALLSNAMAESLATNPPPAGSKARFLIDGFPRKLDQAVFFEATVCPSELVLFLDCPEEVMEQRLLKRGETSGRDDDNAESIRKRFRTFVETSMPVVDDFEKKGKVVKVQATGSVEDVFAQVKAGIEARGLHPVRA
jgi:UMP-CMP kinase